MRILILDDEHDESHAIKLLAGTLEEALDFEVRVVASYGAAMEAIEDGRYDLVITDVFLPIHGGGEALGRRASRFEQHAPHLGGLVLMDALERREDPPKILVHTACTDAPLIELLDELGHERVRKPAAPDVLLTATLEALGLPSPRF
jgi:CheY-like chemotaxis protein